MYWSEIWFASVLYGVSLCHRSAGETVAKNSVADILGHFVAAYPGFSAINGGPAGF